MINCVGNGFTDTAIIRKNSIIQTPRYKSSFAVSQEGEAIFSIQSYINQRNIELVNCLKCEQRFKVASNIKLS